MLLRTNRAPHPTPSECAATSQIATLLRPAAAALAAATPASPSPSSTDTDTVGSSIHALEIDDVVIVSTSETRPPGPRLQKVLSEDGTSLPSGSAASLLADDPDEPDEPEEGDRRDPDVDGTATSDRQELEAAV